jgi:hypothetical protein
VYRAEGGTRTRTPLLTQDFESSASTNSATSAEVLNAAAKMHNLFFYQEALGASLRILMHVLGGMGGDGGALKTTMK